MALPDRDVPVVTPDDADRALAAARRRATGLLVVVAVGFVASFALPDGGATPWLRAALEAGLVGGLADWFAVVALFRHPLGLPIPHTGVIPRSKDGLGANLSNFVADNFLAGDDLEQRISHPDNVTRLGAWLAEPDNADRTAAEVARVAHGVVASLDRDDLARRTAVGLREQLARLPLSSLAGGALARAVTERRHRALVTAAIEGLRGAVTANRDVLRRRLGQQSPAWVPPAVDDLVFDRAEQVTTTFLLQLAQDDDHELRHSLDEQLLALAERMQHDPDLGASVATAADEALTEEVLLRWTRRWVDDLAEQLRRVAEGPGVLRASIASAVADVGRRLAEPGEQLHDQVVAALGSSSPAVAAWARREVGALIERTVDQWDVEDTSRRLELWLGADLQFVRINGTVVGAMVGVLLHGVARLLA